VAGYTRAFEQLRTSALNLVTSARLLKKMAEG
jgi:hypothetical protein